MKIRFQLCAHQAARRRQGEVAASFDGQIVSYSPVQSEARHDVIVVGTAEARMITADRKNEIAFVLSFVPDEERKPACEFAIGVDDPGITTDQRLEFESSLAGLER